MQFCVVPLSAGQSNFCFREKLLAGPVQALYQALSNDANDDLTLTVAVEKLRMTGVQLVSQRLWVVWETDLAGECRNCPWQLSAASLLGRLTFCCVVCLWVASECPAPPCNSTFVKAVERNQLAIAVSGEDTNGDACPLSLVPVGAAPAPGTALRCRLITSPVPQRPILRSRSAFSSVRSNARWR